MRRLFALLGCLLFVSALRAEDQVLSTRVGDVDVKLFIPGEAKVLRGLIIHAANYKMNPADRWAELCRAMSWGHVVLNATVADSAAKLAPWSEKAERGMMIDLGIDVLLSVSVKEGTSLRRVQFLEGDRPIGESAAAPWQVMWKGIPQGPHAIFAIYETANGQQGTTTPALVTVRAKAAR